MPARRPPASRPPRRPPPGRPATPVTVQPGDLIDVRLEDMAQGGAALGHHARKVVFVPYTIPGEKVTARLTRVEEKVLFAEGVRLLEASADRVTPQCRHFGPGRCRGCQWQHIAYEAQLLLKQDVLADALSRLGGFTDKVLERALRPLLPAAARWHYNTRMTLERTPEGAFGFFRTDGRSIEPLVLCHVLHPDLQALYETLDMDFPAVQRLHLVRGDDGAMMLMLETDSETLPELSADFPVSINVILPHNEPLNLVGDTLVRYAVAGHSLRVTAGSFFRAHSAGVTTLVQQVQALLPLTGREHLLDLYAGVGVFSACLAAQAARVALVESYPPAASDAESNLEAFDHIDIVEGTVEDVLPALAAAGDSFHAAIIDPPAAGMSQAALAALLALAPPRLVYSSSSPVALARDTKALAKAGYRLECVQPIDFAPHTSYIDAVALLEKRR
ncbi:MAG: TRAM domain-containing protein [Anaerolineae bacterium]|nr:TRAM domain-containing protein [Anaerolineae bacterium]